jgi:hypothetical protein
VSTTYLATSLLFQILPTWWVCRHNLGLTAAWTVATVYLVILSGAVGLRFWLGPWRGMRVIEPLTIE